jgi:hypothetical protein
MTVNRSVVVHGGEQMKRRIAAYVAAVSLAVSGLVGIGSPAQAASPTCYELNCNNLDVLSTNCTTTAFAIDGWVLADEDTGATVFSGDLWFSPFCHAFWGEFDSKSDGGVDIGLWGIREYGGNGYQDSLDLYSDFFGAGHWTTKLRSSRRSVKFCWTQAGMGGDTGIGECTKWR